MSLTALLKPATTGLGAAQSNARRTSEQIAAPHRGVQLRDAVQAPQVGRGSGLGVSIDDAQRIFDQHLGLTRLNASSEASRWGAISAHLQKTSEAIGEGLLADTGRIKAKLEEMGEAADAQILAHVDRANDLLDQIRRLNSDISRAKVANDDASGSQYAQNQLVDELAALMNVQVAQRAGGGVTVRSAEGLRLAGDGGAARLSYNRADPTTGYIAVDPADGGGFTQPIQVVSGEIGGLINLRDAALPGLAAASAAEFGASIERQTQTAGHRKNTALAIASEAAARREAGERVDVDAELAVVASYQQAANASARMAQAARALLAVLTA